MHGPLPQRLILYDRPGQKGVVFDTAYTEKQAEQAGRRCIIRHGKGRVRAILAENHVPR